MSGKTWTIPLGVVCTIANGRASAKRVIPGMKIRSPATTGLLFRPLLANPSIPGPNRTFCCFAITGLRTSLVHDSISTFLISALSPRLTPAFFLIIPSTLITPRFASSGLHLHTMAAVFFSPSISMMSPGFRFRSLSKGTLARPWPTSLGIAFATLNVSDSDVSVVIFRSLPLLLVHWGLLNPAILDSPRDKMVIGTKTCDAHNSFQK